MAAAYSQSCDLVGSKRRKVEDRPRASISPSDPRERSRKPSGNDSEKRRVIEIDLASSEQDRFTIVL